MARQQSIWRRRILIPLWTIHFFVLIPPILQQLIARFTHFPRLFSIWSIIWICDDLAMLVCLILEGVEIARWRGNRLEAGFYLNSNGYKVAYWCWNLVFMIWRSEKYGWDHGSWVLTAVLQLASFLIALGYGAYVWRQQRYGRLLGRGLKDESEQIGALRPPAKLNSADNIKSQSRLPVRLAIWVAQDPRWLSRVPSLIQRPLGYMLWIDRYAICCIPIIFSLPLGGRLPGEPRNHWNENTSPAMEDWDYPKPDLTAREAFQDEDTRARLPSPFPHADEEAAIDTLSLRTIDEDVTRRPSPRPTRQRTFQPSPSRLLGPRYLCFITDDQQSSAKYTTKKVEDWMEKTQTRNEPDYIFISYTRRQFYSQIHNDPAVSLEDLTLRRAAADRDKIILVDFAVKAAKDAGVPAFWIDFECVQPEDDDAETADMEDVYRICDIVRGSHSLTIISGPPLDNNLERTDSTSNPADWLLDWGKRLWTLPEALLCPSEHRISIYSVGSEESEKIAKRNLPSRLWDDAGTIRQLIDHYEASLQLSRLELISIALGCLQRRQTETRHAGDVAYALMGLLRLRPKVNKSDSDFQAFARLSIANDSDRILERLICLHSPDATSSWHDMQDSWDAKLWHIDPVFQISDAGTNNSVIICDATGTSIDWTSLKMVDFIGTASAYHASWRYIRLVSAYTLVYLLLVLAANLLQGDRHSNRSSSGTSAARKALTAGIITWILAIPVPYVLSRFYRKEIQSTQARVFGVVGVPDLAKVEKCLFGDTCGRLKWNLEGCVADADDKRSTFTLIDTLSMSLTTFHADKPPTMLFAGGRERGMLRVLLCSYDEGRRAFVKETVTRLESAVSTRLSNLDRFSFSVQSAVAANTEAPGDFEGYQDYDDDLMELPDVPEFISLED